MNAPGDVFTIELGQSHPSKPPLQGGEQKVSLIVTGGARFVHAPFTLQSVLYDGATVTLAWLSVPGCNYRIEHSSDLTSWTAVPGDVPANQSLTVHSIDATGFGANHFFRVKCLP